MTIIKIKTTKSNHIFNYSGDITIALTPPFITISGEYLYGYTDDLIRFEAKVYDKFWGDEIEYIIGITRKDLMSHYQCE